jgi:hypothetical protein
VLFRIEIVVTTFPVGEVVLVETGTIVVINEVGSVVDARVNSVVGIVGTGGAGGTVVAGVVTASGTGVSVQPAKQTDTIKIIAKPIYFIMSNKLFLCPN